MNENIDVFFSSSGYWLTVSYNARGYLLIYEKKYTDYTCYAFS